MKKFLVLMLSVVMLITLGTITAFATETEDTAEASYVAQVGSVKYETIDEAITAWESGTTLTLLSDVTLSDVITISSTESRILNLGTYTMTAASGKNAIQIVCNNRSSASNCLTINADSQNPGGISADSKSCVYYRKTTSTKDRPVITFNGGIFNGTISSYSPNRGTNTPQYVFNGGEFNKSVSLGHSLVRVFGGTFNSSFASTGDSSSYRQISGGRFKSFGYMTADASNKFWLGTSLANYNVGVYVDKYGYLVVGGDVITEAGDKFEASSTNYGGWSSYLKYSSAATYGLFYETVEEAFADNNKTSGVVTVYTDALDLTSTTYKGSITVSEDISDFSVDLTGNKTFTGSINLTNEETIVSVVYDKETEPAWTVDSYTTGKIIVYADIEISTLAQDQSKGILVRNYFVYENLQDAINEAIEGDIIVLTDNIVLDAGVVVGADKNITIDLNGFAVSMVDASSATSAMIKNNGTLTIKDGSEAKTGKLSFKTTTPSTTNSYASNTISNYGTLVVENGTIENTSEGSACYAIDGYANSTTIINGGYISATKTTVRVFDWTTGSNTSLKIAGGHIYSGAGYAVNFNMGNTPALSFEVTGGTIETDNTEYNLAVYVCSFGSAENVTINVSNGNFGGSFAINDKTATTMSEGNVAITGGTFDGGVISYATPAYGFVSGGTFAEKFDAEVLSKGYVLESTGNGYAPEEATIEDIFTFKGYSVSEDGTGVTVSYSIDKSLLNGYCEKNGVEIILGAVYSVGKIGENAIYKSFEGLRLTTNYHISLKNIKPEHAEKEFAMALYIEINGEKSFVTGDQNGQAVIVDAISVEAITYNEILASQTKEDNE